MSENEQQGFKDRLSGDLAERYPKLVQVIDDALESKRKVWTDLKCKGCGKSQRQLVEVQDVDAAMKAAAFLAEHGHGKPGTVSGAGSGGGVTMYRIVGGVHKAIDAAATLWGEDKAAELRAALVDETAKQPAGSYDLGDAA